MPAKHASRAASALTARTAPQILIADFFFILVILTWFLAGLAERSARPSSTLLDSWYTLWPVVFQPALGVLMLGALVSGLSGRNKGDA